MGKKIFKILRRMFYLSKPVDQTLFFFMHLLCQVPRYMLKTSISGFALTSPLGPGKRY